MSIVKKQWDWSEITNPHNVMYESVGSGIEAAESFGYHVLGHALVQFNQSVYYEYQDTLDKYWTYDHNNPYRWIVEGTILIVVGSTDAGLVLWHPHMRDVVINTAYATGPNGPFEAEYLNVIAENQSHMVINDILYGRDDSAGGRVEQVM